MKLHPAYRLLIPAAIFVIFAGMPRKQAEGVAAGPSPVLSPTAEEPPDVPLSELFHELTASDDSGSGPQLTVLEFSDFGCPYCGKFENEIFPRLRKDYVDSGRVRWRFIPFVLGIFPNGLEAMRAATCVAEQDGDAFWKMHDVLFEKQDVWKTSKDPDQLFRSYAVVSGAEATAFTECYEDSRSADRATAANALASRAGVRSTPTFFVGRQMVQGALPEAEFRKVLEQALKQ